MRRSFSATHTRTSTSARHAFQTTTGHPGPLCDDRTSVQGQGPRTENPPSREERASTASPQHSSSSSGVPSSSGTFQQKRHVPPLPSRRARRAACRSARSTCALFLVDLLRLIERLFARLLLLLTTTDKLTSHSRSAACLGGRALASCALSARCCRRTCARAHGRHTTSVARRLRAGRVVEHWRALAGFASAHRASQPGSWPPGLVVVSWLRLRHARRTTCYRLGALRRWVYWLFPFPSQHGGKATWGRRQGNW